MKFAKIHFLKFFFGTFNLNLPHEYIIKFNVFSLFLDFILFVLIFIFKF